MKHVVAILSLVLVINAAHAQQTIPLYESAIPNSKPAPNTEKHEVMSKDRETISEISIPEMMVFLPQKPATTRTAVIIFPGGGYRSNAIKHEGIEIARKFNAWGIAAFVVKYRIPNDVTMQNKEIGPLQDAQQAISLVRQNADKWNVDPSRVGILGFSAGGHLASTAGTHFNKPVIDNNKGNVRPDFMILGYPVISFNDSIGHLGSRNNLLGESPSREKILEYSNELRVNTETPPTFLIHASDDKVVPVQNSIVFFEQLIKHNVPAELHIYEGGGHGFGMNNPTTSDDWMDVLRNWLISRKLLQGR